MTCCDPVVCRPGGRRTSRPITRPASQRDAVRYNCERHPPQLRRNVYRQIFRRAHRLAAKGRRPVLRQFPLIKNLPSKFWRSTLRHQWHRPDSSFALEVTRNNGSWNCDENSICAPANSTTLATHSSITRNCRELVPQKKGPRKRPKQSLQRESFSILQQT